MTDQEILGRFRCLPQYSMDFLSDYIVKGQSYGVIFAKDRMILYLIKVSLMNRLFGGDRPYNYLQASKRERLKMKKESKNEIKEVKEAHPDNFEILYSDIVALEVEPDKLKTNILLFLDEEQLESPTLELVLPYKQEYEGEFFEFFEAILPDKL